MPQPNKIVGHRIYITDPGNNDTELTDLTDLGAQGGTLLKFTIKLDSYAGTDGDYFDLYAGSIAAANAIIKGKWLSGVPESVTLGVFVPPATPSLWFRYYQGGTSNPTVKVDCSWHVKV